MIVRRFMYWLRVTVIASLRGARQRSAEPSAREPMLVGSTTPRDRHWAARRRPLAQQLAG